MAEWIPIDEEDEVYVGDVLHLRFKTVGMTYITAAQIALVEKRLEKDYRLTMLRHSIPVKDKAKQINEFTIDVRVDNLGATGSWLSSIVATTLTVGAVAGIIIKAFVIGFMLWITFAGATKLVKAIGEAGEDVTETIEEIGWTAMKIAAAAIIGFIAIKWIK